MEEFDEAQNIGELLRNTRLKKGKTLGDVSKDLCIRKFYLEAIENLDTKNLPQMPYGIGFVRTYAEYLSLNSARVVQAYRQAAYPDDTKVETKPSNTQEENNGIDYAGPHLLHILVGLAGVIVIFIIWSVVSSYNQSKQIVEDNETMESDVVPEPVIIEDSDSAASEIITESTEAVSETTESQTDKSTENLSTEQGTKAEKDANKTKPANEAELTQTKTETETSEIINENKATPTRIHISFSGPSWLELRKGNKILLSGIYAKGFQYDIPNEAGLIISVGRYYNVDFFVDGKLTKIASAMKQTNINLDKYILPEQKQE